MSYRYDNAELNKLGFRCDEDERTRLDDIQHAVEVLTNASDLCHDSDMRTPETFAALDYLGSIASRKAALVAFKRALDLQHPEQRRQAVTSALRSIQAAIAPKL